MTTPQQAALTAFSGRIASNSLTATDISLLTAALANIIPQWGFGGTGAPPDARGYGGQTDEPNAREWFATLYAEAENFTGGSGPVIPPSWLVPAWFIDPVSGNDSNTGQSSGSPFKTWAQLVSTWGTVSPTLAQNTTITFLSTQPDNTDPIVFRPLVRSGAVVSIQGTAPTVVATVVLASTTAKNRATPQLLQTQLGASGAVGLLLNNTTHASRAWAYKLISGTTFAITQPLTATSVPDSSNPTEVDTWANGDSVQILRPVGLNIVEVNPIVADFNASANNGVILYQFQITNPTGNLQNAFIGGSVALQEVSSLKLLVGKPVGPLAGPSVQQFVNVFSEVGATGDFAGGAWQMIGGALAGNGATFSGTSLLLDGDVIVGSNGAELNTNNSAGINLGLVALDGGVLDVIGSEVQVTTALYGSTVIWGSGTLRVDGMTNLRYGGASTAVATFVLTGGLKLNNDTTANSLIVGSPNVYNGGISLTAAHLDAAAGAAGFGGFAVRFGGGSFTAT